MTYYSDFNYKYAIYGGTFDPIHRAHVVLADTAVKQFKLNELYFMPANISPFKLDNADKQTSADDRYSMIEEILHYNYAFRLSDYELRRQGPSYTVQTLKEWDDNIDGKLFFVLGFDSVVQVDRWFHGIEILQNYPLITGVRPGTDTSDGFNKIREYREKYGAEIHVLDMPPMEVSSSSIRKKIAEGKSISDMVMPETEEYIIEHYLYR